MSQDIDAALKDWEYKPGAIRARMVEASDGRQVLQMRLDLGVLQMEPEGRPDGTRPHGCLSYFDYLKKVRKRHRVKEPFVLTEEQCLEADREFIQFYHRRICWLALRNFTKAIADAEHTLAFMDFVRDHSPNEEYTLAHEQYRSFVLFQRTQARAALAVEADDPEAAIDAINAGREQIREFFVEEGLEEQLEEDPMVQHLGEMEQSLRKIHNIEATLQEQLDRAVANEEYEKAARLRDALLKRQR
jgi:hypothetical protein